MAIPKNVKPDSLGDWRSAYGVPPAFDVAADLPDGPVHVLDDVGAGQRPAQFDRQSKAGDGEDFVNPLQDAAGNAGIFMFQAAGQVLDKSFGLVGVIQFPRLSQRFADTGVKGLGKTIRDVAGLVDLTVNRPFNCGLLSSHFLASLLSTWHGGSACPVGAGRGCGDGVSAADIRSLAGHWTDLAF